MNRSTVLAVVSSAALLVAPVLAGAADSSLEIKLAR